MRIDAIIVGPEVIPAVSTRTSKIDVLEFGADDRQGPHADNHLPGGIAVMKVAAVAEWVVVVIVVPDLRFTHARADVNAEQIVRHDRGRCARVGQSGHGEKDTGDTIHSCFQKCDYLKDRCGTPEVPA